RFSRDWSSDVCSPDLLSIDWLATITKNLSAGRGFIALATVVFSGLNPLLAIAGGLIFGFFNSLALVASTSRELTRVIPYQFLQKIGRASGRECGWRAE